LAQAARFNYEADLRTHVEAQVGRYLLIAAAASVQLEAEQAYALHQLEFDEVMNVFGGWMVAHLRHAHFRSELGGNRIERIAQLRCLTFGEDLRNTEGRRVGLAGGYFLRQKPPIEDDRPLPRLELAIERLPKAAGPHLDGLLFVGH